MVVAAVDVSVADLPSGLLNTSARLKVVLVYILRLFETLMITESVVRSASVRLVVAVPGPAAAGVQLATVAGRRGGGGRAPRADGEGAAPQPAAGEQRGAARRVRVARQELPGGKEAAGGRQQKGAHSGTPFLYCKMESQDPPCDFCPGCC